MQYAVHPVRGGGTTALLTNVDDALIPSSYQSLLQPEIPLGDGVQFLPKSPRFGILAVAWAFLAPSCAVGLYFATAHMQAAAPGTVAIQLLCVIAIGVISWRAGSAAQARVALLNGRWRYGIFMTEDTLLVRLDDNATSLLPRSAVSGVHIFNKVEVLEHAVSSGVHTHIRIVYFDANGDRMWTDVEAAALEMSAGKTLKLLQAWLAAGTHAGNVALEPSDSGGWRRRSEDPQRSLLQIDQAVHHGGENRAEGTCLLEDSEL